MSAVSSATGDGTDSSTLRDGVKDEISSCERMPTLGSNNKDESVRGHEGEKVTDVHLP